jgi:hypothetical protein
MLLIALPSLAQNWKQVHKKDEEKWAKTTGLDVYTIHKLWRAASRVPDESDDDSRIADIDLDGLAERHEIMLVTYAGENNCLTITVLRKLSETKYDKAWQVDKPPDGAGFCDSSLGTPKAVAENGAIAVRVPRSAPTKDGAIYTLYMYQWNGITYRVTDEKDVQ